MIVTQIVYDVLTNKKHEEEIEVPDIIEESEPIQPPTLEERISCIERQLSNQSTILSEEVNKVE